MTTRGTILITDCDHPSIDVERDILSAAGWTVTLARCQTAADVVATFGELSGLPARAARQRASDILDLVGLDEARFRSIGEFSTGM